jgi:protein gp37
MTVTTIEWTRGDDGSAGETWNPSTGCDKVSPGCGLPRFEGDDTGGCYALAMAKRLKAMGQEKYQNDGDPRTSGPGFGVTIHPDALTVPLRWRKPRRVFVNSMSDLGHARIPRDFLAQVWAVMAATPQHTYQILSKRPDRLRRLLASEDAWRELLYAACHWAIDLEEPIPAERFAEMRRWIYGTGHWPEVVPPLPNVHLGTSIELDRYTDRADELRETPAAVRFLSLEPLLGPLPSLDLTGIDWAIIGGESGPDARPMDLWWVRHLIDQCRDTGTAVFVKQLGSVWARTNGGGKGGDWDRWPADLRIREFPGVTDKVPA